MKSTHRAGIRASAFLLFMLCTSGAHAQQRASRVAIEADVARLVQRIEARYGRMRGLAADFEQVYRGPGARERRERGRLFLQRPRRMRWEYDPKPGKLFIVNGREVWFYSPADREATHAETNNVSDARFPFLFLLGQTNLRRDFRSITFADQPGADNDAARVLRLIPAANVGGLREIYLTVTPDGQIIKLNLVDEAGATSEVSLTNTSENFIAPSSAFEFHPPTGVTVRRQR
ncbi:MAG TPA: outer membrane lipoprotein chaperone LolA [Pyrinomonadaceae bacterium]|jgi:outer membrane lipoprotein carrier protein|nr:outer membrane lipoprotein chaperone LolA [Pyrinomonadaceae bacterium]